MFFIARCLIWFTVIYVHLPANEGAALRANQFLDLAGAHVDALVKTRGSANVMPNVAVGQVATVGAAVGATGGAAWCRDHAEACADAVLAAMQAKSSARTPLKAIATDTLSAPDRGPRWQAAMKSRG